jgi:phage/plasmid-like protein (TIGR03299 family)
MPAEVETMMYTGEVPWHGLGTFVGEKPVLSQEAIVAAGLDWKVVKAQAFAAVIEDTEEREVMAEDWFLTVRTLDDKVLGAVQGKYSVLQNSEAFSFMDSLVGDKANNVVYHTAGSLQGGRHIWMLAKIEGLDLEPCPGDTVDPYILLVNGHDGRMPLKALFTSVRVVCQNTLNIALSTATTGVTIRHTGNMGEKLEEARRVLGFARKEFEGFAEISDAFAHRTMTKTEFDAFLDDLIPLRNADEDSSKRLAVREKIIELAESGPGTAIPGVKGTAWGALQAITDFTAHHRATRGHGGDTLKEQEKRLESVWFGTGSVLNNKALTYLRRLVA